MTYESFREQFRYDQAKAGYVGIERECFVAEPNGLIVPKAARVLKDLPDGAFGYELSACQVESRIGPARLEHIEDRLHEQAVVLDSALRLHGLAAVHREVGPADMPVDVFPDPTGRYQRITADLPREVLLAACRVIGTHVHIGMRDHEMALRVYNHAASRFDEFCELGNGSFGERLAIYRQMAPNYLPRPYSSWREYHDTALEQGFVDDPRKCWTLIRISVHGTIEFRMFGATDSIPRIVSWAKRCHAVCMEALAPA